MPAARTTQHNTKHTQTHTLLAVPMASFLQHQHRGPLLLSEIRVEACVQSDALLKGYTTFFFNLRQTSCFHMCTCPGGAAAAAVGVQLWNKKEAAGSFLHFSVSFSSSTTTEDTEGFCLAVTNISETLPMSVAS